MAEENGDPVERHPLEAAPGPERPAQVVRRYEREEVDFAPERCGFFLAAICVEIVGFRGELGLRTSASVVEIAADVVPRREQLGLLIGQRLHHTIYDCAQWRMLAERDLTMGACCLGTGQDQRAVEIDVLALDPLPFTVARGRIDQERDRRLTFIGNTRHE